MPRDLPVLASNRLRLILENHETTLGTTFPPRTRTTLELNRSNRFHSETNLNRPEDDEKENEKVRKYQFHKGVSTDKRIAIPCPILERISNET